MAIRRVNPLRSNVPIVDGKGNPTPMFQRLWQSLFLNDNQISTLDQLIAEIFGWTITAGTGLDGGGAISSSPTIDLADTAVTPGSYGDATNVPQITIDQQGRITSAVDVPISGGGGGGFWWFSPPVAADFPTTVTEGAASGTSVVDDADVGLALTALPSGNDNLYAILQTAPTPPFTIVAHFTTTTPSVSDSGIPGIVLRASGTGLRTVFGADPAGGVNGLIIRRSTGTTFNANLAVSTSRCFAYGLWLRIVVTSLTDVVYSVSGDGKNWNVWQSNTANGQVASLDQIGIGITRRGAMSQAATIACDYWDVA